MYSNLCLKKSIKFLAHTFQRIASVTFKRNIDIRERKIIWILCLFFIITSPRSSARYKKLVVAFGLLCIQWRYYHKRIRPMRAKRNCECLPLHYWIFLRKLFSPVKISRFGIMWDKSCYMAITILWIFCFACFLYSESVFITKFSKTNSSKYRL